MDSSRTSPRDPSQQINITYDLSEKIWRTFYNAHYASDKRFKLRFFYGTVTWSAGACGLLGLFDNQLIAFGLYCVFAKQYLVNKAVKKIKLNHIFQERLITA